MVIAPESKLHLIQCPLKLDDNNQITFSNATAQYNYFVSLNRLYYEHFTYIRKDNIIRVTTAPNTVGMPTYEDLLKYNYVMYQNSSYDNKWFYAFITDVTYINDGTSEITIDTDAFQTWQFDLVYKNSFIEREHVSSDTIGEHTLPESLEHGPYICMYYDEMTDFRIENSKIVIGTTWLPSNTPNIMSAQIYGGVFSGVYYVAFDYTGTNAKNFILALDGLGRGDAIVTAFMCPNAILGNLTGFTGTIHSKVNNDDGTTSAHDFTISGYFVGNDYGGNKVLTDYTIYENSTLYGYTPKNNKLFCYPYNYLLVTNNNGNNAEFHYEDFINNIPVFDCIGTLSPGGSVKLYPKNYKKIADSTSNFPGFNDGIIAGKFPVCSWQNDSFTNWMTQQSVNHTLGMVGGIANAGTMVLNSSVGVGNTAGAYGGLFGQQAKYLSEVYQHALVSPQANGSINGANVTWARGEGNFAFYKMTIKQEYAKIIDDFFSQFGYKVNRLATPNIHKRLNWDYMKTTSANLEGNIPEKDMLKIKTLFDNGCTFWHNPNTFLDYTQSNSIL